MTYCIGLLLEEGLVMMSDTRTNAGVDNFSSFPKMHKLAGGEDRTVYAATAGSLSTSQSAIALLGEGLPAAEEEMPRTLLAAPTMFRAAQLVGEAVRITSRQVNAALQGTGISGAVSILLGGRIGTARPSLFLIYAAGNFIECSQETPFFQIGENKYGKPILDRNISYRTPLAEAVKVCFLSYDSAIRSNLGVARPIDIMIMPADPDRPILTRRIEAEDEYFDGLSAEWGRMLHEAVHQIADPPFMDFLQPGPGAPQTA